jgi:hypothetical protein
MAHDEHAIHEALAALDNQEHALAEELQSVQGKLARVRAARASLNALVSEEPTEFEGKLADAIRNVLMAHSVSYVPTQVRDKVKELGYVFREDSNQMAAVHGVLKRLVESGEVKTKQWKKNPGITRYYWHTFEAKLSDPKTNPGTISAQPTAKSGIQRIIGDSQARRERLLGKKGEK